MSTDNISIHLFSELEEADILAFNKKAYPNKAHKLNSPLLKWQFRIGYDAKVEPIYIKYEGKIVGQAALQPIMATCGAQQYMATWYNNFIVLPSMQGKGLGKILTQKWMELAPLHITNCNDNSMAVFRKLGWDEEFHTVRYGLPININALARSKGWTGVKAMAAAVLSPLYSLWLKMKYGKAQHAAITPIKDIPLDEIVTDCKEEGENRLVRDKAWVQWRLLDSPYANKHYRIKLGDAVIYFRVLEYADIKRIHILYQNTNVAAKAQRAVLQALVAHAIQEKVGLLWGITNVPALKELYDKVLFDKLSARFAYHSQEGEVMQGLKNAPLPLQSIDSDYDFMYF
ncbi:MAG: GNAT family N-acetyltransferase [Flavipsychrobacter sp.]